MTKEEFEKKIALIEDDPERRELLVKLSLILENLPPEKLKVAMRYMEEEILTYASKT
jgi:hypothetical protein